MNSISPLSEPINQLLEEQLSIKEDLMKPETYSMEKSTNNDTTPTKNNMTIIIPLINPPLFSTKAKFKTKAKGNLLDFDKVLSILMSKTESKKKGKRKPTKASERNLLNRKTSRSSSIKKKVKKHSSKSYLPTPIGFDKDKPKKNKVGSNSLYSIDNFISSTLKIVEKKEFVHIECPKYKEIEEEDIDVNMADESDEDIRDDRYKALHWPMEEIEINRRISLNSNTYERKKASKNKDKADDPLKNKNMKHSAVSHTDSTIDEKHCAL